jgi:plastocyanin
MRKGIVAALVVALCVPATTAAGAGGAGRQDSVLFAGGGTPLTNGVFFPGTVVYDGYDFVGEPLPVQKGSNVEFINLDYSPVTNSHQIRSFKLRRGRPLFQSKSVDGPGQTLMITSHVKLGTYYYFCTTHASMFGAIEITE